jgi:hypothetical protein
MTLERSGPGRATTAIGRWAHPATESDGLPLCLDVMDPMPLGSGGLDHWMRRVIDVLVE